MIKTKEELNNLSGEIVDAAMEVHRKFKLTGGSMNPWSWKSRLPLPSFPFTKSNFTPACGYRKKCLGLLINFNVIFLRVSLK